MLLFLTTNMAAVTSRANQQFGGREEKRSLFLPARRIPRKRNLCYNTRHISWDGADILCPFNVGFCELASQKKKFNTGREGAQRFVAIWVLQGLFQLNVTRIVFYDNFRGVDGQQ